jgi:hypothetical protein
MGPVETWQVGKQQAGFLETRTLHEKGSLSSSREIFQSQCVFRTDGTSQFKPAILQVVSSYPWLLAIILEPNVITVYRRMSKYLSISVMTL